MGPGTRVFEVDCGDGALLVPFQHNGYLVGGIDADPEAIARAIKAMPEGHFQVSVAAALDPAMPWHVVMWRYSHASVDVSAGDVAEVDHLRGVLARMFAKATHAIVLLDVPDARREWMMHALAEVGASAIQFETALSERRPEAAEGRRESNGFNVFARV